MFSWKPIFRFSSGSSQSPLCEPKRPKSQPLKEGDGLVAGMAAASLWEFVQQCTSSDVRKRWPRANVLQKELRIQVNWRPCCQWWKFWLVSSWWEQRVILLATLVFFVFVLFCMSSELCSCTVLCLFWAITETNTPPLPPWPGGSPSPHGAVSHPGFTECQCQNNQPELSLAVQMLDLVQHTETLVALCSDITNDQLGISGETGHGGANLYIYWMNSAATCTVVVQIYSWCVTPHSSPTRGG